MGSARPLIKFICHISRRARVRKINYAIEISKKDITARALFRKALALHSRPDNWVINFFAWELSSRITARRWSNLIRHTHTNTKRISLFNPFVRNRQFLSQDNAIFSNRREPSRAPLFASRRDGEDLHEGASRGCLGACALWRGDAQPAGHPIKCWANMWEEKKKDLLAAYVTFMVRIHPLVRVSAPILAPR